MYVDVAAQWQMFLKKSFGFAKLRLLRLMSLDPGLAKAHFEETQRMKRNLMQNLRMT